MGRWEAGYIERKEKIEQVEEKRAQKINSLLPKKKKKKVKIRKKEEINPVT